MPPSEERPLLLVVDDDEVFRNRLCRAFEQRNWETGAVPNGGDALKFACDRSPISFWSICACLGWADWK